MNIQSVLGTGFQNMKAEVILKESVCLTSEDFRMSLVNETEKSLEFLGTLADMTLRIYMRKKEECWQLQMEWEGNGRLACRSLGWSLSFILPEQGRGDLKVPCAGRYVSDCGLYPLNTGASTKPDSRLSGLFFGPHRPCLLIGTEIPQKNLHLYTVTRIDENTVWISGKTTFPKGQGLASVLRTEVSFIYQGLIPVEAVSAYGRHVSVIPEKAFAEPLIGWNSWDYYFSALRQEDIWENADCIEQDPVLKEAVKCVIVDMGWEHREGEWYANYRFPDGLKALAEGISRRGLIPGIWTNGCEIHPLSYPALRNGEMLLRNADHTLLQVDQFYVIDPTHPAGEKFLYQTYKRLFQAGFRIFKVDFVDALLEAEEFYDAGCGPYDAVRRVFEIVRQAVGHGSYILGCAYPPECGAGYADSCRIGVDIHNHWEHVLWILEYLQINFWENGRLFRIDPDFMLVRGIDTSLEEETNVLNPMGEIWRNTGRHCWRSGPVFDQYEAETWANIVVFSGGNVILGDRLGMLNQEGLRLIHEHLKPAGQTAVPLDLGAGRVAAFWYLQEPGRKRLLMINHSDREKTISFSFAEYGLPVPENVFCGKKGVWKNGVYSCFLNRHESAVAELVF